MELVQFVMRASTRSSLESLVVEGKPWKEYLSEQERDKLNDIMSMYCYEDLVEFDGEGYSFQFPSGCKRLETKLMREVTTWSLKKRKGTRRGMVESNFN